MVAGSTRVLLLRTLLKGVVLANGPVFMRAVLRHRYSETSEGWVIDLVG